MNNKLTSCCNHDEYCYVSYNPELSDKKDYIRCEKCGKPCEVYEVEEQCVGDEVI